MVSLLFSQSAPGRNYPHPLENSNHSLVDIVKVWIVLYTADKRKGGQAVKIAFLILAHHRPEQLKKLMQALDDPRFDFFVHVDRRENSVPFLEQSCPLRYSKLKFISRRHRVFWGDISMVDATLELFHEALKAGAYERFVLLSGEDYPIQSNDTIYARLTQREQEFINGMKLKNTVQVEGFWFWKLSHRFTVRCIRKLLHLLRIRKKPWFFVEGRKWEIYHASQWVGLTRECAQHLVTVMDQHPRIRRYFRFSHAPDQLVIPTILYNTPEFRDKTTTDPHRHYTFNEYPALHYMRYHPQRGTSVEYLDESAYEDLLASGKLFLRKVSAGKSDRLVAMLDAYRTTS